LLATKGKPLKRLSKSVHQVLEDRVMRHSEKPNSARERIVKLFGNLPRIELFARQKTEGWDVWGNEIESDIKLT
jgi:N6-adenosine-specific RNA methylase IME4